MTATSRGVETVTVLILYDSRGGLVEQLAGEIAAGARRVSGVAVRLCRIRETQPEVLLDMDALIIGSPNWSGITGALKEWFDGASEMWETGEIVGKVGAAFTAGWSRSGGTEATLLQLIHLLLAHGLYIVGLPWSDTMRQSGSYYGATAHGIVAAEDRMQAHALGRRVAEVTLALVRGQPHR